MNISTIPVFPALAKPTFARLGRRQWFVLGLLLFFVGLSVQYSYKITHGGSAIQRWRSQILQIEDVDIYNRFTYPNPPMMAILLEGLAEMDPFVGSLCWFYAKVGMALLSLSLTFRLIEA